MERADRICEKHARRQGGFVSREQCIRAGLTPREIYGRLQSQGWTRWLPNVYLLPGISPDIPGRLGAALLWGGERSVLSHGSAAWVHQLDGSTPVKVPEVYVSTGKSTKGVRARRLPTGTGTGWITVKGLRVTRVERTLLDLSFQWDPSRVGRAMDDALRRGLTSLERLATEAARANMERQAGAAIFRRLVTGRDHRDAKVRSRFETLTLRLLNEIEPPHPNHHVDASGNDYYLDFAYPDLLFGIECQSIRWHLGEEAFKADMARHRHLSAEGWMVLFVCWDDVLFERERLKREIAEALCARRAFMRPELLPRHR